MASKLLVVGNSVRVSGASQDTSNDWLMTTVSYNGTTGVQLAAQQTGGTAEGIDIVTDLYADNLNTYVIGAVYNSTTGYDWKIVKLSATLTVVWTATYNGSANAEDIANALHVDDSGNVYVTGFSSETSEGKNMLTRKYNSSGVLQWSNTYHYEGDDEGTAIEMDNSNNIIVSGSSFKVGNLDFVTASYKGFGGAKIWEQRFNSDYNKDDVPTDIAVSDDGDIYILGNITKNDGKTTYVICRYGLGDVSIPQPTSGYGSAQKYVANKGQLRGSDSTATSKVKFYNTGRRVATFIEDKFVNYQLSQGINPADDDTLHRVRMHFSKGATFPKVYAADVQKEYHNYYLGHMEKPSERTPLSNVIVRPDVYANTDVLFSHSPSGFKHWIIADASAPTSDFEMTFAGQTSLTIDANGDLIVGTSIGDFNITQPEAYTMNTTTGNLTALGWQPDFTINGSVVEIANIGSWTGKLVLGFGEMEATQSTSSSISLEWSTYINGSGEDEFESSVCDEDNNVNIIGNTTTSQFNGTLGIEIGNHSGNQDFFSVKFNSLCEPVYSLFYGGSNLDTAKDIARNKVDGTIYVVGCTESTDLDFITENSMEDGTLGGSRDGIYAKFDPTGILLFHTYVGGELQDELSTVTTQTNLFTNEEIIFYAGYSTSSNWNMLVTETNSYSQAHAGAKDGIIFKRTGASEQVVWSTFFGSDEDDMFDDVAVAKGSPILIGRTAKETYTLDDCAAPTDGGFPKCGNWNEPFWDDLAHNNFVAWFGDDGTPINQFQDQLLWSSFLCPSGPTINTEFEGSIVAKDEIQLGSGGTPSGYGPENPWVVYMHGTTGNSGATIDFPFLQEGWHQSIPGNTTGGWDGFICKFRNNGITNFSQIKGTLYGSEGPELGRELALSADNTLFITGRTALNDIQPSTDWCSPPSNGDFPMCDLDGLNYTETNIDGSNNRAYVAAFLSNGQMRWSTQFGDGKGSISNTVCTNNEKVWIAGWTNDEWTELDFEPLSLDDYYFHYQFATPESNEATIARFDIETIVGIDETSDLLSDQGLIVFPNPSNSLMTIQSSGLSEGEWITLNVFDLQGKLVFNKSMNYSAGTIDLSTLERGMYLIQVESDKTTLNTLFQKM